MIVRCGACRNEFDVPGPGRHPCPACGAVNQVGVESGPTAQQPGPAESPFAPEGTAAAGPPPELTRISCPECTYSFIVGEIAVAVCPNCDAKVEIGKGGGA